MTPMTTIQKWTLAFALAFLLGVILLTTPLRNIFKPKIVVNEDPFENKKIEKLQNQIKENQTLLQYNDTVINILEYKIDSLNEILTINNNTLKLYKKRRTNVQKFDYSLLTDSTINEFFAKRYK